MQNYFSLIKFSHTIFAMPFALLGFVLGYLQSGSDRLWELLFWVVLCMVFARSAAMAFNRYLDRDIDASNPRTKIREIPSGKISAHAALLFTLASALLFVVSAYFINRLCFFLSPIALLVILGYSYTKRFTALCHFVLGLGLGLAPVGAYLAVTGSFALIPVLLGLAVLCWVSGFDIIYALQDEDFDKSKQLHSVPALLGGENALKLSRLVHFISALLMFSVIYGIFYKEVYDIGFVSLFGGVIFAGLLIYQQSIVSVQDLSRVNLAFFTSNGIASLLFGVLIIADLLWL